MKKNAFNQSVSIHIFVHDHIRKDGKSTIYLRVTIDRKKKEFNLNTHWPNENFDKVRELASARHPRDQEVETVNHLINAAKGKAHKIKLRYFTDEKQLTLDQFAREFVHYENRDNFLFYWETKMNYLFNQDIISKDTLRQHKCNLGRLKQFLKGTGYLSMADINLDMVKRYNAWLKKTKKLEHNSVCTAHKAFRGYINLALEDGYKLIYPYEAFKVKFQDGDREPLEEKEIERLRALLNDPCFIDTIGREVLRKFLFSCYTGLRISDNKKVNSRMITDWKMHITLQKGGNGKRVGVKLPEYAKDLIDGRNGVIFNDVTDKCCNRWLKVIAKMAKISKKLTFHVSRDTFGTSFIERGGDVPTLQKLMGHSDIRTTMIYVKMSEKRADKMMDNFNDL